jgi:uncharacterized membrane protein
MTDRPTVGWTARALSLGTLVSAGCFLVGLALNLLAQEAVSDQEPGLEDVVRSALALDPWGWSMLGVIVLLVTPVAGLVATALELRQLQPRGALLALAVLGLLALAVIAALAAG